MKTPVQVVVAKFGGATKFAKLLGIDRSAIYQWQGRIPSKYQARIIDLAQKLGISLTCDEIILGEPGND